MKVKSIITRTTESSADIEIKGITLLSIEEYEQAEKFISCINEVWCLRSPGTRDRAVACVHDKYGYVDVYGSNVRFKFGVRPALQISNLKSTDLEPGDKIELANYTWTIIPGDMALCDDIIEHYAFRKDWKAKDANEYNVSDVKQFVENWWTNIIETKTLPMNKEAGVTLLPMNDVNLNISGIKLLSFDEFEKSRSYISAIDTAWWLRSPGFFSSIAACVDSGSAFFHDVLDKLGVRPALKFQNTDLSLGDKFKFIGYTWTVISDSTALCDDIIGRCAFRTDWETEDANDYEASDIKRWLDDWWSKIGERMTLSM